MLKLAKDFYIVRIVKNRDNNLNKRYEYFFRYKNYRVELEVEFLIVGYTKEDNSAIVNFGYTVDIERWSNRLQRFKWINDLDNQNGKSTKKYLDSQVARELVLRFVERALKEYLKKVSPAILIRGAHSELKVNLPRYKRLDKIFFEQNYKKRELDIKEYKSLYETAYTPKKDDKVIWAYSKKDYLLDQLSEVIE